MRVIINSHSPYSAIQSLDRYFFLVKNMAKQTIVPVFECCVKRIDSSIPCWDITQIALHDIREVLTSK